MGVVLIVVSVLFAEASNEAVSSFVLASVKKAATFEAGEVALKNHSCINTALVSLRVVKDEFFLNFSGCKPRAFDIADRAEEAACGTTPNLNDVVDCGGESRRIIVQ